MCHNVFKPLRLFTPAGRHQTAPALSGITDDFQYSATLEPTLAPNVRQQQKPMPEQPPQVQAIQQNREAQERTHYVHVEPSGVLIIYSAPWGNRQVSGSRVATYAPHGWLKVTGGPRIGYMRRK